LGQEGKGRTNQQSTQSGNKEKHTQFVQVFPRIPWSFRSQKASSLSQKRAKQGKREKTGWKTRNGRQWECLQTTPAQGPAKGGNMRGVVPENKGQKSAPKSGPEKNKNSSAQAKPTPQGAAGLKLTGQRPKRRGTPPGPKESGVPRSEKGYSTPWGERGDQLSTKPRAALRSACNGGSWGELNITEKNETAWLLGNRRQKKPRKTRKNARKTRPTRLAPWPARNVKRPDLEKKQHSTKIGPGDAERKT